MKTTNDSSATPATRRATKRQADHSLFENTESGDLLSFENPDALAFVRDAVTTVLQPANDLERLFTDHLVRNLWRTLRSGNLETAAIDVEMAEHKETAESRWGNLDPESLYHLSTRDPATRSAIREYGTAEGAALRRFKHALDTMKTLRSK